MFPSYDFITKTGPFRSQLEAQQTWHIMFSPQLCVVLYELSSRTVQIGASICYQARIPQSRPQNHLRSGATIA